MRYLELVAVHGVGEVRECNVRVLSSTESTHSVLASVLASTESTHSGLLLFLLILNLLILYSQ